MLTVNDNLNEACPEMIIKCPHCEYTNKRKIINGSHYIQNHSTKYCKICNRNILKINFEEHYEEHINYVIDKLNEF